MPGILRARGLLIGPRFSMPEILYFLGVSVTVHLMGNVRRQPQCSKMIVRSSVFP